jgi:hypothetical protein
MSEYMTQNFGVRELTLAREPVDSAVLKQRSEIISYLLELY